MSHRPMVYASRSAVSESRDALNERTLSLDAVSRTVSLDGLKATELTSASCASTVAVGVCPLLPDPRVSHLCAR
jgi:hypothetical protein